MKKILLSQFLGSSHFSFITTGTSEELSSFDGMQVADSTFLVADIVAREEGDVEFMTIALPKMKKRLRYDPVLKKFSWINKREKKTS